MHSLDLESGAEPCGQELHVPSVLVIWLEAQLSGAQNLALSCGLENAGQAAQELMSYNKISFDLQVGLT